MDKQLPRKSLGGRVSSADALKRLGFDPIEQMVLVHLKLAQEVERQEKIRSGELVELSATGRPRAYSQEVHHALFDRMIKSTESLLRYRYARVPEKTEISETVPSLTINLSNGETIERGA